MTIDPYIQKNLNHVNFYSYFEKSIIDKKHITDDAQIRCAIIINDTLIKWHRYSFLKRIFPHCLKNFGYGVYIHGPVGTGKTTLMDLICSFIDKKKHRDHFKPFMLNFHRNGYDETLNKFKKLDYLFLDEIEIIDIADALIIKRLFNDLNKYGVKIFMTSNIPPIDLYKNGLHFDRFQPFINYIETYYKVLKLDNGIDYRLLNETPLSSMPSIEQKISGNNFVEILDKKVPVRKSDNRLIFSFHALCGDTLGPVHYEAFVKLYDIIYIENLPPLFTKAEKDSLRRFITLVDFFYDQNKKIIILPTPYISIESDINLPTERLKSRLIDMFKTSI